MRDLPLPQEMQDRIVARWRDLTLVQEVRPTIAPGAGVANALAEAAADKAERQGREVLKPQVTAAPGSP